MITKSQIKNRPGFTLVELLLALAMSAMLLAAVGVAFNASAINYQENEEIFKTINNARQALFRMTTQLRTAEAVATTDPNGSNECTLMTPANEDITYRYDNTDNKLYLDTNDNSYVLCENVTAMTFTKNVVFDEEESLYIVKSVQISITVSCDDMERSLAAAAVIRRNLN
jgi:prepilin-type N-terminal cleavage/methylation domain-containing protein